MNNELKESKLFKIFNRNIQKKDKYTQEEIETAFQKSDYSLGNKREKELYIKFFQECNTEDIDDLKKNFKTTSQKIKKLYISFSNDKKIEFGTSWASKFRLPKITPKILPRDHNKYIEIDNFETYELTPCIAYEMAIRNKDVKKIFQRHKLVTDMMEEDEYAYKRMLFPKDFETEEAYQEYEDSYLRKHDLYDYHIKTDHNKFIDEHIKKCTELDIVHLSRLKEKLEEELVNDYLIYPTGYYRPIPGADKSLKEKITNSKDEVEESSETSPDGIIHEHIVYKEFTKLQTLYATTKGYAVNNIIPNFHRQVNDQEQIRIAINFSLPIDEIVEYISRIKKQLNSKSPLELLGKEIDKANNLKNMTTSNEKVQLDGTKGENPQQKLADMLYVYDMRKEGFTYTDIIYELERKYSNKSTAPDSKTLKKYFDIAEEYIDQKKYKELITGKVVNS